MSTNYKRDLDGVQCHAQSTTLQVSAVTPTDGVCRRIKAVQGSLLPGPLPIRRGRSPCAGVERGLAVAAGSQGVGQPNQLLVFDPAVAQGDLGCADLEALTALADLDEMRGGHERVERAAVRGLHGHGALGDVVPVDVGDLELAAGARAELARDSTTSLS